MIALAGAASTAAKRWAGGRGFLSARGTFAGTLSLECRPPSTTGAWIPVGDSVNGFCTLTQAGCIGFAAPKNYDVRVSSDNAGMNVEIDLGGIDGDAADVHVGT